MDIWSLVKKKLAENAERTTNMENNEEKKQDQNDTSRRRATHIIVCGNSQSGKSTLINKFLDKNEEHKETVALEYTYARRTRGNNKDICHIWELGGGTSVTQLLAIPFTEENIERASFVIALDLTRPNELWITMEKLLSEAQRYIKTVIKNLDQNKQAAIKNKRSYMNQEEKKTWFPIPLLIVGTKYDEFQNFDSEQRRRICTSLRFTACYYGAHLMFYSCYNEQLVRIGRSIFSHLAFGSNVLKAKVIDHNKPLYVINGTDSIESVGMTQGDSMSSSNESIDLCRDTYCNYFPQKDGDTADETSEEQKLFRESMIDGLILQREKDLEIYLKQTKDCH